MAGQFTVLTACILSYGVATPLPYQIVTDMSQSFLCGGSLPRLPSTTLCDGYPDCPFGEDELNCSEEKTQVDTKYKINPRKDQQQKVDTNVWNPMKTSDSRQITTDNQLWQNRLKDSSRMWAKKLKNRQFNSDVNEPLVKQNFNPFDFLNSRKKEDSIQVTKSTDPCVEEEQVNCRKEDDYTTNKNKFHHNPVVMGSFNPFDFVNSEDEKKQEKPIFPPKSETSPWITISPRIKEAEAKAEKIAVARWGEFPRESILEEKLGSNLFVQSRPRPPYRPPAVQTKTTFEVFTAFPDKQTVQTTTTTTTIPSTTTTPTTTTTTTTTTSTTPSTTTFSTTTTPITTTISTTTISTTTTTITSTTTTTSPTTTTTTTTTTSTTTTPSTTTSTITKPSTTARTSTTTNTPAQSTIFTATSMSTPISTSRPTTAGTTSEIVFPLFNVESGFKKIPMRNLNTPKSEDKKTDNARPMEEQADAPKQSKATHKVYAYYLDDPCKFTTFGCKLPYNEFNKLVGRTRHSPAYQRYGYRKTQYGQYNVPYYSTFGYGRVRRY